MAARHGFEMPDAMELADRTYVSSNIHDENNAALRSRLAQLPTNCASSADILEARRNVYEQGGIFTPAMIDGVVNRLRAYADNDLAERAVADPELTARLVARHFHCG